MTIIKKMYAPTPDSSDWRSREIMIIEADGNDYEVLTQKGDEGMAELRGSMNGSITVIGEGCVTASRCGNGNGDAICKCTGKGRANADRRGNGNGDAIRICGGNGSGWAFRQDNGNGQTIIDGDIEATTHISRCESRNEGRGNGDAIIRTGKNLEGKASRLGSGTGHAIADGEGHLNAERSGMGVGGAIHTGKGKGVPCRYLDEFGLGTSLAVREKGPLKNSMPQVYHTEPTDAAILKQGGRVVRQPS